MKENNDIYNWGEFWNLKSLMHYLIALVAYFAMIMAFYLFKVNDDLQIPEWVALFAVVAGAYIFEFVQMRISRAKIDLTDVSVALAAALTGVAVMKLWVL